MNFLCIVAVCVKSKSNTQCRVLDLAQLSTTGSAQGSNSFVVVALMLGVEQRDTSCAPSGGVIFATAKLHLILVLFQHCISNSVVVNGK